MTDYSAEHSTFKFPSPRQKEIYNKLLNLVGPGPAAFWKDACFLMERKFKLESTAHIVAHLLREIESSIRDVLETIAIAPKKRSKNSKEKHKEEIRTILEALDISLDSGLSAFWLDLADKESSFALHKLAHRRNLEPPRKVDVDFREFWEGMEAVLLEVLGKFETKYLRIFEELDSLASVSNPSIQEAEKLKKHFPNNIVTRRYFYNKLKNPTWISPLGKAGFFRGPPEPIYHVNQGEPGHTVSFPQWPESQFLANMAQKSPELVCDTILSIPDTDNVQVHEDFIEAALVMPANLAVKIAKREIKWLKKQEELYLLLPDKLGELVAYLAKEGEVSTALELARILLELQPDLPSPDEDEIVRQVVYPRIKAKYDFWMYEEILSKHIPLLAEKAPEEALTLLCTILKSAIEAKSDNKTKDRNPDFSHIWRPAIEEHERNVSRDFESILVSSIRETAEEMIKRNHQKLLQTVQLLEKFQYPIFQRLILHLLRIFPDVSPELVAKKLTDRYLFDDHHFRHEYPILLKERFQHLPTEAQQEILDWIEEGPDIETYKKWYEQNKNKPPTEDEIDRYKKTWQRDRLSWFKDSLPEEWKEHYKALVEELGKPEYPGFAGVTVTWVGPESPLSAEKLRSMSISEIVEYLKSWNPPHDSIRGPSPEGLGRALAQVVEENPGKFAEEAESFKGVDPTYVRYLLSGLRDALKAGKAFNWEKVLKLCKWAVEQKRELIKGKGKRELFGWDPHWGWARKTIADLLSVGFDKPPGMPFEFRELAWGILEPLTNDPDPTPEDEAEYGGSNMDPVTLSINTTRGEAMHAVIRYALWCKKHLDFQSIDDIPEVKNVLEQHLNPDLEPSLAVRSVYGQWLPWLVQVDREWVSHNLDRLFPKETHPQFWEATWASYIETSGPHSPVFEILLDEYQRATEHIGKWDESQLAHLMDPDERLAEHLLAFYWAGVIDIDDAVFKSFWELASDDLRAHAIEFIGRSLLNYEGEVPQEPLEKMKLLWEHRLAKALEAPDRENRKKEVAAFGWWFASDKFENEWAFQQLLEAIRFSKGVDPMMFVIERLAYLSDTYPQKAALCFKELVSGNIDRPKALGWRREAEELLEKVLQSGDEEAKSLAEEAINRLAAMGFLDFIELLRK